MNSLKSKPGANVKFINKYLDNHKVFEKHTNKKTRKTKELSTVAAQKKLARLAKRRTSNVCSIAAQECSSYAFKKEARGAPIDDAPIEEFFDYQQHARRSAQEERELRYNKALCPYEIVKTHVVKKEKPEWTVVSYYKTPPFYRFIDGLFGI